MVCQVGTPENLVDALRGQCVALKQQVHASEKSLLLRHSGSGCFDATQASPLLERIEEYNRQHGFREVGFLTRSRKQAAGLQSWPDAWYGAGCRQGAKKTDLLCGFQPRQEQSFCQIPPFRHV